jgi:phospholipid/cholesterol/gamma-HCH transport system substrate-binding protein
METSARYTLIGSFVLAIILGLFAFVYWLANTGGLSDRQFFRIKFQSSVSGLLKGSSVVFNGIRVGEVTDIALNPEAPKEVMVTIAVDPSAPVRDDTAVNVDFQGLTGAPVIELSGGEAGAARFAAVPGEPPPLLNAGPESTLSLTQSARETLGKLDKVIDENSDALHSAIQGISTFAGALARNSERIDGILAGLERFAGGTKNKPGIYALTPLTGSTCRAAKQPQLVIPEPAAPMAFNSDKVVVLGDPPENAPFDKAQFTDNIPSVIQSKFIESFENSDCFAAVTRPLDNLEPSDQLQVEIRRFAITMAPQPAATIALTAKLVAANGKIVGSSVFEETSAVAALDASFGKILTAVVPWTAELPRPAAPAKDTDPKAAEPKDSGEPDMPEPPPAP